MYVIKDKLDHSEKKNCEKLYRFSCQKKVRSGSVFNLLTSTGFDTNRNWIQTISHKI
jgi:hypothetical protein